MDTIFLQKNTTKLDINQNINLILSPEFYWVRLFDIPIKSKKEVLKVLPNLFEDFFDTDGYSYFAIKQDNQKYLCFAYKKSEILNYCKSINLDIKYIDKIYFAQNEFYNIVNAINIDGTVYTYQDNIFVKIPKNMESLFKIENIDLSSLSLSEYNILLNRDSKYIDNNISMILSMIFILFSFVIFTKIFLINNNINYFEKQKEIIQSRYNLLPSTIQTKSVLQQYNTIGSRYRRLRDAIFYIVNFKQQMDGKLDYIKFKNNILECRFSKIDKQQIIKYIKQKYKISTNDYKQTIIIKVKL